MPDDTINSFILTLCKLKGNLNGREIKYLIWRFYFNLSNRQISQIECRRITRQAVNYTIQKALRKIKQNNTLPQKFIV